MAALKGSAGPRCYTGQNFSNMKTRSILILAASLCLPGAALAADPTAEYAPMKIIQTEPAIFPFAARDLGITEGTAHVSIAIDETGKLTDFLVTEYSYPAFGEAATIAVKKWQYKPAYLRGQPCSAAADLTFNFESKGIVVVNLDVSTYVEQWNYNLSPGAYGFRVCTLKQLDRIPTPTKVVRPMYPLETAKQQAGMVTVTVQFFIDQQGHVRLPSVSRQSSEANDQLAAAAVEAVSQWEFEPPLSHGHPVLVEARQEFNFKPQN